MKQPLEKQKIGCFNDNAAALWTKSEPFVENARGYLIHRPRSVTTRRSYRDKHPYISVHYLCGLSTNGDKNLTFLDAPPIGSVVCHACEARALMIGLPSSSELAGRHVCTGKLKIHNTCPTHGALEPTTGGAHAE